MRYIDLPEFGDADVMRLAECERPAPAANEVLIRVIAAGVNRPDVIQRQGLLSSAARCLTHPRP